MRLKDLFFISTEQKVTEKHLRWVLIASVCSILLCMSCLVSTTWALFAVTIKNTENVIQIGTPEVLLTVDDPEFEFGSELLAGTHKISIKHTNESDDFQKKSTLYVTLTIDETTSVYTTLSEQNQYSTTVTIIVEEPCSFTWVVTWFEPGNAELLTENTINITAEEPTDPTEETTEETTKATEEATESSEETTDSTEEATESAEDTIDPTEETSVPTEEITTSTGTEIESTEPT